VHLLRQFLSYNFESLQSSIPTQDFLAIMLQATGDRFERPAVHAFLDSLMDLEHEIPGSCEVLIDGLLHRLGRLGHHLFSYSLENRPWSFLSS